MTESIERKVTDNIWTDVTIRLYYVDRGNVSYKDINLQKDELEKQELEVLAAKHGEEALKNYPPMSNQRFQAEVIRSIQGIVTTPIAVTSKATNEMRFLPPSAIREVTITVNNIRSVVQA